VREREEAAGPHRTPALERLVAGAGHLPIAVDAMGGDFAPREVVAGARLAVEEHGIPVVLFGRPDAVEACGDLGDVPLVAASEVIAMDADPGASVRRLKDSSLVRAAEAVRDGAAAAMVSAGNTGAAMAASLLRMGRVRGIARPAIAIPIFTPGDNPTLLLDAGANAECQPEWLVQFAQMGAVYARLRYGIERPRIGLMSIGEESVKGNSLVKDTHRLMTADDEWLVPAGAAFIGNIEGRDIMRPVVDVAVTDGFTGNVALKALEGFLSAMIHTLRATVSEAAFDGVHPTLSALDPENTGGGMLLGVRGVSIISHGSSSAHAIVNAIRLAQEMVRADVVGALAALTRGQGPADVDAAAAREPA
jgi:glycerol-3-phosphate acyltransferase PlsX